MATGDPAQEQLDRFDEWLSEYDALPEDERRAKFRSMIVASEGMAPEDVAAAEALAAPIVAREKKLAAINEERQRQGRRLIR